MNITDEEIASLKATTSEAEWNDACSAIKKARDGAFPPDWFSKVRMVTPKLTQIYRKSSLK